MQPTQYGPPISLSDAQLVAEAAEAESAANGWAMVIAVIDSTDHLVVLHKMDHAQLGSIGIAQAKAHTAVNFKRSTKVFEDGLANGGINMRLLATEGVCPVEGGVLLARGDRIIGAVGASGAQPMQDEQVAVAGTRAIHG